MAEDEEDFEEQPDEELSDADELREANFAGTASPKAGARARRHPGRGGHQDHHVDDNNQLRRRDGAKLDTHSVSRTEGVGQWRGDTKKLGMGRLEGADGQNMSFIHEGSVSHHPGGVRDQLPADISRTTNQEHGLHQSRQQVRQGAHMNRPLNSPLISEDYTEGATAGATAGTPAVPGTPIVAGVVTGGNNLTQPNLYPTSSQLSSRQLSSQTSNYLITSAGIRAEKGVVVKGTGFVYALKIAEAKTEKHFDALVGLFSNFGAGF